MAKSFAPRLHAALTSLLLAAVVARCTCNANVSASTDGGDAGEVIDSGGSNDSGSSIDGGEDAGFDGSISPDASPSPDGSGSVDSGSAADANAFPDAGTTADAGSITDSGDGTDSGISPDAGTPPPDAGVTDAGPSCSQFGGTCSNNLQCFCCPGGGPLEHCLCSTACSSDSDCRDPTASSCKIAPTMDGGFCGPTILFCCWFCG
jgi:hypothetical protein